MPSLRLLSTSVLAASALMGLAPPTLAAAAVDPAASAPIAAGDTLLPATVMRDNLWTLAARVQHDPGITRQQVMVAMLRRNPNAFLQGNMHRLRRDVALVVPTTQEIAAEGAGPAESVVAAHLQALEQGTAVAPLAPVTGAPVAAAKPATKAASAPIAAAPTITPASAVRPAASQAAAATEPTPTVPATKVQPKPVVPATPAIPAVPPQATATPAVPAASAVPTSPTTGSVIQAPAEVPAVVAPTQPAVPVVPAMPAPAVSAAASTGAQPAAGEGARGGADLRWWPALAAVALLGAAGVVWVRRRPGATAAATATPSSFFDENGVRRQSRPKLIDVSQAGVETARTVETLQAAAQMVRGAEAGPAPALSPDDPYREATIKLEIARTNLELGRIDVAKAMLHAVRREGSAAQQLLAGDLLHSLSPT